MSKFAGALARLLVSTLLVAGVIATSAIAQEKGKDAKPAAAKKGEPVQKVYFENDAVRVFEVTFKPGDAAANIERPLRVIRVLKGGTLTLIYPDGKKEKLPWKTGEVKVRQPSPAYSPKNEGKSDIVLYVVYVKQAKK
ncbi:MAG: hypothetical protein E6H54_21000 [Betaproteobacteria bacterium]|nr:MAG: hypothetical protein E6H54_21000 [Betaproteobacteria bacterium]